MYALVVSGQILARGEIPGCAKNLATGAMVCPPNGVWTDPQAAACGWLPVTTVARPTDTPTQTSDYSVVLVSGSPAEKWTTRAKTAAEQTADTRTTNQGTLTAQATAAIATNEGWINNTSPQVQAACDTIQALTWPTKPTAATTIAQVNASMSLMWDSVLVPLVAQLSNLSQAVETDNVAVTQALRNLNATMRLVAGALDSTSGT